MELATEPDTVSSPFKVAISSIIISTPEILFLTLPSIKSFKQNTIFIEKNSDYSIENIEKQLVKIGYKKVDGLTSPGEFSRRGDILDIFNIVDKNPTRFDFFDTTLESIYTFDFLTFEKKENLTKTTIAPNKLCLFDEEEKSNILNKLSTLKTEGNLVIDLSLTLERNEDVPLEFLTPFCSNLYSIFWRRLSWIKWK